MSLPEVRHDRWIEGDCLINVVEVTELSGLACKVDVNLKEEEEEEQFVGSI